MVILGTVGQCPEALLSLPRHLGIALSADPPSLQTNSTHTGAPAPPYLRTSILPPPENYVQVCLKKHQGRLEVKGLDMLQCGWVSVDIVITLCTFLSQEAPEKVRG